MVQFPKTHAPMTNIELGARGSRYMSCLNWCKFSSINSRFTYAYTCYTLRKKALGGRRPQAGFMLWSSHFLLVGLPTYHESKPSCSSKESLFCDTSKSLMTKRSLEGSNVLTNPQVKNNNLWPGAQLEFGGPQRNPSHQHQASEKRR